MTFDIVGKVRRPRLRRAALSAGALIALFCVVAHDAPAAASAETTSGSASATESSDRGLARIRVLIGDARCTVDADCHTIGIGARACGGPESYAAWSSAVTVPRTLDALVSAHRAARVRELAAQGAKSTCAVTPDPGAACVLSASSETGHCRLRPPGANGSAV